MKTKRKTNYNRRSLMPGLVSILVGCVWLSCIGMAGGNGPGDWRSSLIMPWVYGDMLTPDGRFGKTDDGELLTAWDTDDPVLDGYVYHWLIFGEAERDLFGDRGELTSKDVPAVEAQTPIVVDAFEKKIALALDPDMTKTEFDRIRGEMSAKTIISQTEAAPDVFYATVYIRHPVELHRLKEMLIPYSLFPLMADEQPAGELIGTVDTEPYENGYFVYTIMTGFHYNFILKNNLFEAIEIRKQLEYDDLIAGNFDAALSDEELEANIEALDTDAEELELRYPELPTLDDKYVATMRAEYALLGGLLRGGLTRLFNKAWRWVKRATTVRLPAWARNRLKFDRSRLKPPKWIRDRLKFNKSWLESKLQPPKWIRDRLKVPDWVRDRIEPIRYKHMTGLVKAVNHAHLPISIRREAREIFLRDIKVRFVPKPVIHTGADEFPPLSANPLGWVPPETNINTFGFFRKKVVSRFMGANVSYNICVNLDSPDYSIHLRGLGAIWVCLGSHSPTALPKLIFAYHKHIQTAAVLSYSRAEVIRKYGFAPGKVRWFNATDLTSTAAWLQPSPKHTPSEGTQGDGGFAPCGLFQELGGFILNSSPIWPTTPAGAAAAIFNPYSLNGDVYVGAPNVADIGTIIHEYSHHVHCSLIGRDKAFKQLKKFRAAFATDELPQFGFDRLDQHNTFHEGVANYFEFEINGTMDYCSHCFSIEENWAPHYVRLNAVNQYEPPDSATGSFLAPITGDSELADDAAVSSVTSLIYDVEDTCGDYGPVKAPDGRLFGDSVALSRIGTRDLIRDMQYPGNIRKLYIAIALKVGEERAQDLYRMHGMECRDDNPFVSDCHTYQEAFTLPLSPNAERMNDDLGYNTCPVGVGVSHHPITKFKALPTASLNERGFASSPLAWDSRDGETFTDFEKRIVPEGAYSVTWVPDGKETRDMGSSSVLVNKLYTTQRLSWKSHGGSFEAFRDAYIPDGATEVTWHPEGKPLREMGYVKVRAQLGHDTGHIEYDDRGGSWDLFRSVYVPPGATNVVWHGIGKQPQDRGVVEWTACGGWAGFLICDPYYSEEIEIDQMWSYPKHPLHFGVVWHHYYYKREGRFTYDLEWDQFSLILEYDQRHTFQRPPRYYGEVWQFQYHERVGRFTYRLPTTVFAAQGIEYDERLGGHSGDPVISDNWQGSHTEKHGHFEFQRKVWELEE